MTMRSHVAAHSITFDFKSTAGANSTAGLSGRIAVVMAFRCRAGD